MPTLPLFDRASERDSPNPEERERQRTWRVSEVNRSARRRLEELGKDLWIEGELSDVTRASSGHVYFTLNDQDRPAQLAAVMFRGDAQRSRARFERGELLRVRGTLTVYEPRGTYQLMVRTALPAGEGDLHAEFERIRRKLEESGLLDPARKRPLPRLPRVVGVVTSATGAAMHDITRVAKGRCPVRIVVADCRVQGQDAPASIVSALHDIQRLPRLDVVIIGRGGGSAEDLWAFNHESVARAIASCRAPTVSAVGHEVDVTIADLVADVRASTPSNAAEIVVPDRRALTAEMDAAVRHIQQAFATTIGRNRLALERQTRGLRDPRHAVGAARKRLESCAVATERNVRRRLSSERERLASLVKRLTRHDARAALGRDRRATLDLDRRLRIVASGVLTQPRARLAQSVGALGFAGTRILRDRRATLERTVGRLSALSPLAVLARGYAIALHDDTGRALVRASDAEVGDGVELVLGEGRLRARVESVEMTEEEER